MNFTQESYTPSIAVRAAHNIPHLSKSLKLESNVFNYSIAGTMSTSGYTASLLPFPAIILALGLLSILIFLISMCSRTFFETCKAAPKRSDIVSHIVDRRNVVIGFFIFFFDNRSSR